MMMKWIRYIYERKKTNRLIKDNGLNNNGMKDNGMKDDGMNDNLIG